MALTPNSPNADNSMQALKQYGSYIITAILVALAGYFGWTYWQNNHARVNTVARSSIKILMRWSVRMVTRFMRGKR